MTIGDKARCPFPSCQTQETGAVVSRGTLCDARGRYKYPQIRSERRLVSMGAGMVPLERHLVQTGCRQPCAVKLAVGGAVVAVVVVEAGHIRRSGLVNMIKGLLAMQSLSLSSSPFEVSCPLS